MYRRAYLGGTVTTAAMAGVAGCSGLLGPDPVVESVDGDQSLSDSFGGSIAVEVVVENDGRSGDVGITVSFEDDEGTVVGRETHGITMDSDERRREEFSVDVPDGADVYTVEADDA